jgi:flagellar motor switch protein FliN
MPESPKPVDASVSEKTIEDLHHFLDVPVKISIRLGTRIMKVRDILQLQPSSIVELAKSAGENVDILINNRLIAFGEVLELEGCTGIRLTDFNSTDFNSVA